MHARNIGKLTITKRGVLDTSCLISERKSWGLGPSRYDVPMGTRTIYQQSAKFVGATCAHALPSTLWTEARHFFGWLISDMVCKYHRSPRLWLTPRQGSSGTQQNIDDMLMDVKRPGNVTLDENSNRLAQTVHQAAMMRIRHFLSHPQNTRFAETFFITFAHRLWDLYTDTTIHNVAYLLEHSRIHLSKCKGLLDNNEYLPYNFTEW